MAGAPRSTVGAFVRTTTVCECQVTRAAPCEKRHGDAAATGRELPTCAPEETPRVLPDRAHRSTDRDNGRYAAERLATPRSEGMQTPTTCRSGSTPVPPWWRTQRRLLTGLCLRPRPERSSQLDLRRRGCIQWLALGVLSIRGRRLNMQRTSTTFNRESVRRFPLCMPDHLLQRARPGGLGAPTSPREVGGGQQLRGGEFRGDVHVVSSVVAACHRAGRCARLHLVPNEPIVDMSMEVARDRRDRARHHTFRRPRP